jgi:hypothetical protein
VPKRIKHGPRYAWFRKAGATGGMLRCVEDADDGRSLEIAT